MTGLPLYIKVLLGDLSCGFELINEKDSEAPAHRYVLLN